MADKKDNEVTAEDLGREENPAPEANVPNTTLDNSPAVAVSASELVAEDKDRPIADNKVEPPPPITEQTQAESATKKRGRPKMTEEQKAAAKEARKSAPDFSDITGNKDKPIMPAGAAVPVQSNRNYFAEACELFIPLSFAAGKFWGDHWSIPIKQAVIDKDGKTITPPSLDFTEEQKNYLQSMSRWLEYEKFPPMNARIGFLIASVAYTAPKFKTDPTPERLGKALKWIKDKAKMIYLYFKS